MNGDDPSSLSAPPTTSSMQTTTTATTTLTSNKRRHSRAAEPSRKYSVPDAVSAQHRRGSSGSIFLSPTPQQKRLPPTPHGQDENSPDTSLMDIDDPRPRGAKRTPFGPHDAYSNHHPNPSQDSLNSSQKSTRPRPADQRSSRGSFYEDRRKSLSSLMIQPRAPSPPLPQLPQEVVDDIYGNLKSFRFGNASPANSPSDGNQSDQDDDVMSPLPRRSPRKMSRVVVTDDHPLHAPSSENDTDEEEKMRQERSKMRAIDDGGRRPSLPINQAVYPSSSSGAPVSRATLGSMSEQLDRQLERRRPSQAISIPRRSSRVSQDEHGKWPGDPQSEPESVRMPWMGTGSTADAAADFDMNFILNVSVQSLSCPPSPTGTDLVGDTFLNHITRFDTEYGQRRSAWLVARQFLTLESGRQDPREIWACDFVGKFNIMRGIADQPGTAPSKLRANQILIRQYSDMPREGKRSRRLSGPSIWIHNHGRKKVLSIFREYNPFKKEKDNVMTPAVSVLFTPRDLRSFHTRNRPRVQYHDETVPGRSSKSRMEHTPPTASSSQPQEHVYPPSYMAAPQPRSTTPRVRSPPGSITASLTSVDELPHRRGHADAFSTIDKSRLASTSSIAGGASDAASTTSTVQRSGGSFTGFFKRKGKDKAEKVFEPPWLTVQPRQQTEEEMERMLFAPWEAPRRSDVSGPDSTSPRVSESSTAPFAKPEASSSRSVRAQAVEETEEEKTRRRVRNLSQSFESVGLIAAPKRPKSTLRAPTKTNSTFLDNVPADSTCFLLPLWPSEAAVSKNELARPSYFVPMTERRYLLVYFVQQAHLNKKRPRQPNATSDVAPRASTSNATEPFQPFHVVAQLVTSNDLLLAGMRSLDKGLLVTGTISDSLLAVPDVSAEAARPVIIALCNDLHALEFVPEGLDKLGLRVDPDDDMSVVGDSGPERGLTPIGRAVAEIIWAACLAIASNLPPGEVDGLN